MKKLYLLCLIVLLTQCKTTQESIYESEVAFVQAFKISALHGCLNEATQGDFGATMRKYDDLGLAAQVAVLYHAENAIARELGEKFSKTIEPHYYYEGKRFIFNDCVKWAMYGNEVDSFATDWYHRNKYSQLQYRYDIDTTELLDPE